MTKSSDVHPESEKAHCKVAKGCFATRQKSPDLAGNFHQLIFWGGKGLHKHDFSCMKNNSEQDSLKFTKTTMGTNKIFWKRKDIL